MTAVAGILLAGGLGRRMGGGDKCLQTLAGRSLLDRARQRAQTQVAPLLLNINGDQQRFPALGLDVVLDTIPGHAGPLAGILAGLETLQQHYPAINWLASFATDTPWFPFDFVERCLAAVATEGSDMAVASSGERRHPVFALWPRHCLPKLREYLDAGERRIDRFTAQYRVSTVDWANEPLDPYFNINTPEDLAQAEATLTGVATLPAQ